MLAGIWAALHNEPIRGEKESAAKEQAAGDAPGARVEPQQSAAHVDVATCESVSHGNASLNMVEEVARFSEFSPGADCEGGDGERRVAAEREKPSSHKGDNKAPSCPDENP